MSEDTDSGEGVSTEDQWRLQIGAELTAIRKELTLIRQALEGDQPVDEPADDEAAWECQCGATFSDRSVAKNHAVEEHNAGPGFWQDIITRE